MYFEPNEETDVNGVVPTSSDFPQNRLRRHVKQAILTSGLKAVKSKLQKGHRTFTDLSGYPKPALLEFKLARY